MSIRGSIHRHPYIAAICATTVWNFIWVTSMPLKQALGGYFFSALIVGFLVGLNRVDNWKAIFTKLPYSFGCYVIVGLIYGVIASSVEDSHGDMNGLGIVFMVMPVIAISTSPILFVGELLGWLVSTALPSNPQPNAP